MGACPCSCDYPTSTRRELMRDATRLGSQDCVVALSDLALAGDSSVVRLNTSARYRCRPCVLREVRRRAAGAVSIPVGAHRSRPSCGLFTRKREGLDLVPRGTAGDGPRRNDRFSHTACALHRREGCFRTGPSAGRVRCSAGVRRRNDILAIRSPSATTAPGSLAMASHFLSLLDGICRYVAVSTPSSDVPVGDDSRLEDCWLWPVLPSQWNLA